MILIFITYWLTYWTAFAWYNYRFIEQKDFHLAGSIVSVLTVIGVVLAPKFGVLLYNWQDAAYLSFVALTIRWCFFDIALNLMRKKEWYFIGITSWMDKNLMHWQFVIKSVFLFLSICVCLAYLGIGN